MFVQKKRRFGVVCCLMMVLGSVGICAVPGGETTGDKDFWDIDIYHGSSVNTYHDLMVYYDYPLFWPHVYQETESEGYNAYNELVQDGGPTEWRNSGCSVDPGPCTVSASVTVNTSIGGSLTSEIKLALGWPGVGTLTLGNNGTLTWELGVSQTKSYSITSSNLPGYTIWWWYKYHWLAHRKGVAYDCVEGPEKLYCTTHDMWCPNQAQSIIDYYGTKHAATVVYVWGEGLFKGEHEYEYNFVIPALPLTNQDATCPSDPYMEEGEHWYDW